MMTFKKFVELLNEDDEYAAMVDSRKNLEPSESGFCLHNPLIKPFAFDNEVNMAILISFVFYTMQKKWTDVKFRFDSFLHWIITTDKKAQKNPLTTDWTYDKNAYFAQNVKKPSTGPKNIYIKSLWENKKRIYDKIIAIYDPKTDPKLSDDDYLKKAIEIWYVLINNVSGLGPTKAAFCVQLMMGKLGCIDSINSAVYKAIAPDDLFTKKENDDKEIVLNMKGAPKDPNTKELKKSGYKIARAYIEFLNYLEKAASMDISKNLWDVWCDIVAQKLNFAGPQKERRPIGIGLPDGSISQVMPYQKDEKTRELINKYLEMLGGKVDARDVSRDHADIIIKSRERIGESVKAFFNELLSMKNI